MENVNGNHSIGKRKKSFFLKKAPHLLFATFLLGSFSPDSVWASNKEEIKTSQTLEKNLTAKKVEEKKAKKEAKELFYQAPEATPLTVEGEEALKTHYVEKYMPVEGCSLLDELPKTSDINYVPPKPKPKPKVKAKPPVKKEIEKQVVKKKVKPEQTATEKVAVKPVEAPVKKEVVSEKPVHQTNGSAITMSEDERFWLEKLVEAESADEPYEGKVAVATIIANRVAMPEFPNTVMGVIRAPKQFSPFMDGSIERRTPSPDTKRAVAQVFDQGVRNLPADAGFFCTTEIASRSWIGQTKPFLKAIGNHSFFLK